MLVSMFSKKITVRSAEHVAGINHIIADVKRMDIKVTHRVDTKKKKKKKKKNVEDDGVKAEIDHGDFNDEGGFKFDFSSCGVVGGGADEVADQLLKEEDAIVVQVVTKKKKKKKKKSISENKTLKPAPTPTPTPTPAPTPTPTPTPTPPKPPTAKKTKEKKKVGCQKRADEKQKQKEADAAAEERELNRAILESQAAQSALPPPPGLGFVKTQGSGWTNKNSTRQRKEQKKAMAQATIDNPLPPTPQKSQQIGGDVFTASPPQNSFSFGFDGFGFNF